MTEANQQKMKMTSQEARFFVYANRMLISNSYKGTDNAPQCVRHWHGYVPAPAFFGQLNAKTKKRVALQITRGMRVLCPFADEASRDNCRQNMDYACLPRTLCAG